MSSAAGFITDSAVRVLLSQGEQAFDDRDLLQLAMTLVDGGADHKSLADKLLDRFGDLSGSLAAKPVRLRDELKLDHRAVANMKIMEAIAKRFARDRLPKNGPILSSWSALLDYLKSEMAYEPLEQFRVLFLDKKNRLLRNEVLWTGTVDHVPIYIRQVVKRALELDASALLMAHNHPSGDPSPSSSDVQVTKAIVAACVPFGIVVHDSLVIGRYGHASLKSMKMF